MKEGIHHNIKYNKANPGPTKSLIMIENCEIRQGNEPVLTGDETSIGMIFNNLTGRNLKGKEYIAYQKFVETQGFDLNKPFEMYKNGVYLKSGSFI